MWERAEFNGLPPEYGHEPAAALRSGRDGMDAVRLLLREAAAHLTASGVLVVEVGNTETRVRRAFPKLPFIWLSFANGGGGRVPADGRAIARGRVWRLRSASVR